MGNAILELFQFSNKRRTDSNIIHRNLIDIHDQEANVMLDTCSHFYKACRDNQVDVVKRLLKHMSLEEIDRKEPNGSTALHVASYLGHYEIVQLLLESGADRAVQNKYEYLPFDEAANDKIKELFYRIPSSNRLVSNTGSIEWVLIDKNVLENAAEERDIIRSTFDNRTGTTSIEKMLEKINNNYINKGLDNVTGLETVRKFFRNAAEEKDPKWIVKAYTAESNFYRYFNQEMAGGAVSYQNERRYIITLLRHHPTLDPFAYTGSSYRVMKIKVDELPAYKINCSFMLKSLVSSSIDKRVAQLFCYRYEMEKSQQIQLRRFKYDGSPIETWVMCIYKIKHHRSALHIESISQYPNEGEVLLMPYSVFIVKDIRRVPFAEVESVGRITEIYLEESDEYINE